MMIKVVIVTLKLARMKMMATGAKGAVTKYNSCQIVYLQSTAGIVKNDRHYKIR